MSVVENIHEQNNDRSSVSKAFEHSQLSTKYFFYTWTLDNFLECTKFSKSKILSPVFEFAGTKWRLWLQPISKKDKLDRVEIRLLQGQKCDSGYYIKCKFSFLNADGSLTSKENYSLFGDYHWGHRLSFKHCGKNAKGSSFIVNDKITIHCELLVLALTAVNSDQVSLSQSNSSEQNRLNKAVNYPSTGLIQLRSTNPISKSAKKSKCRTILSHNGPTHRCNNIIGDIFYTVVLLSVLFLTREVFIDHTMNKKLNMTEVNELIIDSTFKILHIAEALNLTEVKFKSSELLAWYRDNYNIPNDSYISFSAKNSTNVNFKRSLLNASLDMDETDIVDANATELINENE